MSSSAKMQPTAHISINNLRINLTESNKEKYKVKEIYFCSPGKDTNSTRVVFSPK